MRVLVQRVSRAAVSVEGHEVGAIGAGLLVLVGITASDTESDLDYLCRKVINLRVFDDENGVMNLSLLNTGGDILAVSQFTLYADTQKGNRPSYIKAAAPEIAKPLFDAFVARLKTALGRDIPTGVFGADMKVSLINDGPVTLWLDSAA
ncbi:MAG: D-tyrosyl-tRNA(Tyr) deacylase [Burkholderiales bacterium]|jgi:D-tyrosyl-tRNA(Tyr) deacylase|nr:D-tyrosyl-tRNA(Tyr) deacylase [Burkholderiales bacterium]